MKKTVLALLPLALICVLSAPGRASATPESAARLKTDVEHGTSLFLEFDEEALRHAVEQRGDAPLLDVRTNAEGALRLLRSPVPLRVKDLDGSAGKGSIPERLLASLANEMGLYSPFETLKASRTADLPGARSETVFRQRLGDYPVLNSRVSLVWDGDGRLHRLAGLYLPSALLVEAAVAELPSREDTVAAFVEEADESLLGVGVFHGSLFGMSSWAERAPVLAYVLLRTHGEKGPRQEFVDAWTGDVLYSRQLTRPATVDLYADVDIVGTLPPNLYIEGLVLDDPIRLDSTSWCSQGTYPNCTGYTGRSEEVESDVRAFADYIYDAFGRTSWDTGTGDALLDCDDDDAVATQCCRRSEPSDFVVASDWAVDDAGDNNLLWFIFALIGGPYPPNAYFMPFDCYTAFSAPLQCTDVVGHEWGHGIDFAERQMGLCDADEGSGVYCRHSQAMAEAFADIMGESFQQTKFPTEGTPWVMCDGDAYCEAIRNLEEPEGADHSSSFEWEGDCHDNSTAISKAFHLLGRPALDGAEVHYGRSVTGIGLEDATQIFYQAMVQELEGGPDYSLSDLRDALLDAARTTFGSASNQYTQTLAAVDAVGLWTNAASISQSYSEAPGLAYWGQPSSMLYKHPTIVFDDSGTIKYRYRYLSGLYLYWSSAYSIGSSTGQYDVLTVPVISSGVLLGHDLHVFYQDTANGLVHFKKTRSGTTSSNAVTYNGVQLFWRNDYPVRVVATGSGYKLFYVPIFGNYVFMADLNISTNAVTNISTTTIPATSTFEVAYDGADIHSFYVDASGLHHLAYVSNSWGTCGPGPLSGWSDVVSFDASDYMDKIQLVVRHSESGWRYATTTGSCSGSDHAEDWSPENPIGAQPDTTSQFSILAPWFTGSGFAIATQASGGNLSYRTKYSQ